MGILARAVEQFRASGLIHSVDMATGKVEHLTVDEYAAQTPEQLAARRYAFDGDQARGMAIEIRQRNERTT
jgi:hypothetical protein